MMPDGVLSILEIFTVQDSDFATYNCSAANADDSTYLPIKFSKKGTSFSFVAYLFCVHCLEVMKKIIIAYSVGLYYYDNYYN